MPKPPRRDEQKLLMDADKVLRFEGVLADDVEENENRKFVIAVSLGDDSVGVWELKQRNSGHSEGKFASRSRKKNPATGTWFKAVDFYIGALLSINASPFRLTGADEKALSYMEEHPEQFAVADVQVILQKIQPLASWLQKQEGMVSGAQLAAAAEGHGAPLHAHEILTLSRSFGHYVYSLSDTAVDAGKLLEALG